MNIFSSNEKKSSLENNQEKQPEDMTQQELLKQQMLYEKYLREQKNQEILQQLAKEPFKTEKKHLPINTILFILFLPFWCLYWLFKGLLKDK